MSTPRKNFVNYASPYAKAVKQYPSQSEDYSSINEGGIGAAPPPTPQQKWSNGRGRGRYSTTPPKYDSYSQDNSSNDSNRSNCYFYQDTRGAGVSGRGYGGGGHNRLSSGNNRNNYGASYSRGGRGNRGGYNSNRYHSTPQKFSNAPATKEEEFLLHFHPSMLEDPWRELMERLNAIRKSEFNLQGNANVKEAARGNSSPSEIDSENE